MTEGTTSFLFYVSLSGGRIHTEAQVPRRNHVTREHVVLGSNGCDGCYDKTCVIYSMVYFKYEHRSLYFCIPHEDGVNFL